MTLTPEGRTKALADPDYVLDVERGIDLEGVQTLGVYAVLGPYDFWAIEYAYKEFMGDETGELKKVAARAPEPMQDHFMGEDFASLLDETLGRDTGFDGSVVTGRIVRLTDEFAIVDVGLKSEGRVLLKEFAPPGMKPEIKPGDHVVFPSSAGSWVEVDEERLLVCRVGEMLGVLEQIEHCPACGEKAE